MRVSRNFSVTQLPGTIDPDTRAAIQALAQAMDQLTAAINHITFAQSVSDVKNGAVAGNFNATFLTGLVTAANTPQVFFHNMGRKPAGCIEILTIPNQDNPGSAVVNVAGALAITAITEDSLTLTCTAALKVFTLLVF